MALNQKLFSKFKAIKIKNKIIASFSKRLIHIETSEEIEPIKTFDELYVNENMKDKLKNRFKNPTPIQQYLWPAFNLKKDVFLSSPHGTGKTLGYLVPILSKMEDHAKEKDFLNALIVVHSVEDAEKVINHLKTIIETKYIKLTSLFNTTTLIRQLIFEHFNNPTCSRIFFARYCDVDNEIFMNNFDLSVINWLVLPSFESINKKGIVYRRHVIRLLRTTNHLQKIFCCNFWNQWLFNYNNCFDNKEKFVKIQIDNFSHIPIENIKQTMIPVKNNKEMEESLRNIVLENYNKNVVVVFCENKYECCRIKTLLYDICRVHILIENFQIDAKRIHECSNNVCDVLLVTKYTISKLYLSRVKFKLVFTFFFTEFEHYLDQQGLLRDKVSEAIGLFNTNEHGIYAQKILDFYEKTNNKKPDFLLEYLDEMKSLVIEGQ